MHRHLLLLTPKTAVKVAAVATVASTVAQNKDRILQFKPSFNSTVIEAISGAAGEVAQIALVYPLDTIKVRCQAAGASSRQVVLDLWALTRGNWAAFLSALYAGAVPAAALSILVGSVHYCCFCATRRAVAGLTAGHNSSSSSSTAGSRGQQGGPDQHVSAQHVMVSHGATGTHFLPLADDAFDADQQLTPREQQQQQQQHDGSNNGRSGSSSSSSAKHSSSSSSSPGAGDADTVYVQVAEGSLVVNCCAAVITAALTALVESPLELFRHNSQAGHIQGNFLTEMWKALRKSGPRSLYYGFIPYCLESMPYDISELLVVGAAKDLRNHAAVRQVAPAAYDLAIGGLAGAVAVLVSMPFDVIKTYIQTNRTLGAAATSSGASSITASAGLFLSTGRELVAKGGPQALFVGLTPRLAHQVPGAMICWLVIESCHRVLTEKFSSQSSAVAIRT